MDNNDKLISEFFNANKHEIEDNGFSERVMRKIHGKENMLSNMLYVICVILSSILFFVFDGATYIYNGIINLFGDKFSAVGHNLNVEALAIAGVVLLIIGIHRVCTIK